VARPRGLERLPVGEEVELPERAVPGKEPSVRIVQTPDRVPSNICRVNAIRFPFGENAGANSIRVSDVSLISPVPQPGDARWSHS
jgi:hypothetical protein